MRKMQVASPGNHLPALFGDVPVDAAVCTTASKGMYAVRKSMYPEHVLGCAV